MGENRHKKVASGAQAQGEGISRREFAVRAAFVSAAAACLPATVLPEPGKDVAPPEQASAGKVKLSPSAQAEVDSRIHAILARHGSHLSNTQKEDIRRLTAQLQESLESLRKAPIENGDSPALYLKPLVEREKKPAPPKSATAKKKP